MKQAMEKVGDYGKSIARYDAEMGEVEADAKRLEDRWLRLFEDELFDIASEDDERYDDLELELRQYLISGDRAVLESWPVTMHQRVEERREGIAEEVDDLVGRGLAVRVRPQEPFDAMVEALNDWYSTTRDEPDRLASEWAEVLREWRKAAGLTTREAADRLGVSSPTIVRHERGDRRASPSQVAEFIDRIAKTGPLPPHQDKRRAARALKGLFADERQTHEILDELEAPGLSAEQRIEDHLGGLTVAQMEFVAAVVESPDLIDIIRRWLSNLASDPRVELISRLSPLGIVESVPDLLGAESGFPRQDDTP